MGKGGDNNKIELNMYSYLIIRKNFTIYLFFDSVCRDSNKCSSEFFEVRYTILDSVRGDSNIFLRIFGIQLKDDFFFSVLFSVLLCKGGARCS